MKIDAQITSPLLKTLRQQDESNNDRRKQMASRKEEERCAALEALRNLPSASETRKAAARARMELLKSQLDTLMKFSMGKVNPRLIAQLAKELKSLVAQYGGSGVSVPSVPSVSAGSQANAGAGAAQSASAADGASAETAADSSAEAEIQSALAAASAATTASGKAAEKAADDKEGTSASSSISGEVRAKESGNSADKAFFEDAKKLARMIKALLKKGKAEDAEEEKKAKKAIVEMDETIRKVESKVMMGGELSGIGFSYEPSGAAVSVSESSGNVAAFISTYA